MRAAHLAYNRWFGRTSITVAWGALAVALVHPAHGLGVPICGLRAATGVPCPGCGLTRSLSCVVRGMWQSAWEYHPLGPMLAGVLLVIALTSLMPRSARRRIERLFARFSAGATTAYLLFVGAFLTVGVGRAVLHLLQ